MNEIRSSVTLHIIKVKSTFSHCICRGLYCISFKFRDQETSLNCHGVILLDVVWLCFVYFHTTRNRDTFCPFGRLSERSGSIHDGAGNYTADVKCSWLIESGPNTKIRMHVEQFATECGWDHLYIYDGDSVEAPLLAVFSGLMHKDGYHIRRVPEVIARSGSALLHFYSDVAYNMSGFNITYKVNACPSRWVHQSRS